VFSRSSSATIPSHPEHPPALHSRGVDVLADRHKRHPGVVQATRVAVKLALRAAEPVQLPHDEVIELTALGSGEPRVELRTGFLAAADPGLDVP
jgi:hypothetical protein